MNKDIRGNIKVLEAIEADSTQMRMDASKNISSDKLAFPKLLFATGREVAARNLNTGGKTNNLFRQISAINISEEYIKQHPDSKREACKSGCNACCTLRVPALPTELFAIMDYLDTLPNKGEDIKSRILRAADRLKKVDLRAAQLPEACALLSNGSCSIHPVRPINCAKHSSYDAKDCDNDLGRSDTNQNQTREQIYLHILSGQCQTLHDVGLDLVGVELNTGLSMLIKDPDIRNKWYRGNEGLFLNAEITGETQGLKRNVQIVSDSIHS